MLYAVGIVMELTVTDRLHIKYANHLFAEPETGRKSRRDGNAQVKIACILVDFIRSTFNCFIGITYTSWRVITDWFSYSHHRVFVSLLGCAYMYIISACPRATCTY
jgi:hypothetical protein